MSNTLHKDNPALKLEFTLDDGAIRIYTPVNIAEGYHTSRYVAAINQQIYSNSGATKDVLEAVIDDMLLRCNRQLETEALRTDIAALAHSIKYRLKNPIDEHCGIRMGTILSFMEYDAIIDEQVKTFTEQPDKCELHWLDKKEHLALDYPEAYTFFLHWGIANTPSYKEASDILNDSDYFLQRELSIRGLMPK